MKQFLLLVLFLPFRLFSQDNSPLSYNGQLATREQAKANHLRTQQQATVFITHHHGKTDHDTVVVNTEAYDAEGRIIRKIIVVNIDKNHYQTRREFSYNSSGQLVQSQLFINESLLPTSRNEYRYAQNGKLECEISYSADQWLDSTIFIGPGKDITYRRSGQIIAHERTGDSLDYVICEKRISGNDTTLVRSSWRHFVCRRDSIQHTATWTRFDADNKCVMTFTEHYDAAGKITGTDYYNRTGKYIAIYTAPYDGTRYMTWYMPKSKRGKCTCRIVNTYDENGLLLSRKNLPRKSRSMQTELLFSYTFFREK